MRRAIAATVIGGLVLGGAVATPSVAAARGAVKAPGKAHSAAPAKPRASSKAAPGKAASSKPATRKAASGKAASGKAASRKAASGKAAPAMKTVAYEGYDFQVPASWPVYRLDKHPQTCVRYDVHAVYLGTPGPDMRCTAGLVGRTQTVSLIPGQGARASAGAASPGRSATPGEAGGTVLQRLSAVHGTVTQNAVKHELKVALGTATPGATVLGTYGTDPAVVEQVFNTLRLAPAGTVPTAQSASAPSQPGGTTRGTGRRAELSALRAPLAPPRASAATAPASPASPAPAPKPTYSSWPGVPNNWPVQIVQPSSPPPPPSPPP
ncbi:MAG: hypothetical protein QOH87_4108, partial [Trebonia sp.]|nr:hypothetical protein [Trebonia sp.]